MSTGASEGNARGRSMAVPWVALGVGVVLLAIFAWMVRGVVG